MISNHRFYPKIRLFRKTTLYLPNHQFKNRDIIERNRTYGQGIFKIQKIEIHKNWNPKNNKNLYDAAILVLKDPIQYHESINPAKEKGKKINHLTGFSWSRPACFASKNWDNENLKKYESGSHKSLCMAAGYGVDENGASGALKYGLGDVMERRTCVNKLATIVMSPFYNNYGPLPSSYLCVDGHEVGGDEVQDSCQGDSGGPLQCTDTKDNLDVLVQTGIASWGFGCGEKGMPALYTRVSGIANWIVKISKQYGKKAQYVK